MSGGCSFFCKVVILCLFQVTMSNGQVKSRSVHLNVVTPEAIILSTDEYRIEKGSLISIVCILENALLPPEYVFWYQNDRMINYDTGREGGHFHHHSRKEDKFKVEHSKVSS